MHIAGSLWDQRSELLPHGVVVGEVEWVVMLDEGTVMMEVGTSGRGRVGSLKVNRQKANAGREIAVGPADAIG